MGRWCTAGEEGGGHSPASAPSTSAAEGKGEVGEVGDSLAQTASGACTAPRATYTWNHVHRRPPLALCPFTAWVVAIASAKRQSGAVPSA
jgi:hypothetical protein